MSFYPQPNKYLCGPFALKYALVMFGIFRHENDIAKLAGSTWWAGTDEIGLAKAAEKYKCSLDYFGAQEPAAALELLNSRLDEGLPCILSVNNWGHWLTVLAHQQNRYIIVDSGQEKVIAIQSPAALLRNWKYADQEGSNISYDGYVLRPGFPVPAKARFTLETARYVMLKSNISLAKKWDTYFDDLINICVHSDKKNPDGYYTVSDFLDRNAEIIASRICFWHGSPRRSELKKIMNHFRFVAEVYGLVINKAKEIQAVTDFTSILMMHVCGRYGIEPEQF